MSVIAIHRDIFSISPHIYDLPEGETLADMAQRVNSLPDGWPRHESDAICVNGQVVPQNMWGYVKPKALAASGVRTEVTFHAPPMGGDSNAGKQILGTIASIALVAASGGIGNLVLTSLSQSGMAVGRATLLGRLAAVATLAAGSFVLNKLAPSPSIPGADDSAAEPLGSAAAQGNVIEPNGSLARVIGTRKVFPGFVTEPFTYYDGDDEVVEVVGALAGPHKMESIRIGDSLIDDLPGVEYEVREGWPGQDRLSIIDRYARTRQVNSELRGHTVNEDDKNQLETNTGDILDALPQAKIVTTRSGQDAFWIGLNLPQGLFLNQNSSKLLRVPLRMRIRERGTTTWRNLPELHFMATRIGEIRATIRFAWRDTIVNTSAAATRGWAEARIFSPGQTISPTTDDWVADSYFDADTGGDHYVTSDNSGSTDVINVVMGSDYAEIQLAEGDFPKGAYEIEIKRGYAFRDDQYNSSNYQISGSVRDPFWYEGDGAERIYQSKEDMSDRLFIVRTNAIRDETPVLKGNVALIAIRARNANLEDISVMASGYVPDWDGGDWIDWATTDNPAPHIRDMLIGQLNATPVPAAILDDQSFLDFRTDGWSCNAVLQNLSLGEAAQIVAGTGFAQLYQSEVFGINRDYDRSAESPVQIFTPRNTADFSWSRGYPKLPDGYRATFANKDTDYGREQIIHPDGASRTEQITIEGLVTETEVRNRLTYDLLSIKLRSGFYTFDAPAEAIKCRRGSLIGLSTDALSSRSITGRIADYEIDSSGDVTAVALDTDVTLDAEPNWLDITDMLAIEDMLAIGATFGIAIRQDGSPAVAYEVTTSALGDNWVEFATPQTIADIDIGNLAAIGFLGQEYQRLIVIEMRQKDESSWSITCVNEAPEIWNNVDRP